MNLQESRAPLRGELRVPGDKSISHRAVLISALAPGSSRVLGLNRGLDLQRTVDLVECLGARVEGRQANAEVKIESYGLGALQEPDRVLDAGNSGTTLRLGLGVCATQPFLSVLTGDASLRRRPMARVVEPLRTMGAMIDGRAQGTLAPVAVRGGGLVGIEAKLAVASAQTKSAVLLAGLAAEGTTTVSEPAQSRDHTERMLLAAGVPLIRDALSTSVAGPCEPAATDRRIPGDFSSAMFLIAAAILVPGSDLTISGVGLNSTRTAALDVLLRMEAGLQWEQTAEWSGEPVGSITARHSGLRGTVVEGDEIPRLIDEIPVLAVLASQAQGVTIFRGAAELRTKESDRIGVVVEALSSLGGDAEARPDGIEVSGPTPLKGGLIDSRGDHRVALASAIAGLVAKETVEISEWGCVSTSFPEFVGLLDKARGNVWK